MFLRLTQLASKAQWYDAGNRLTNMVDASGTNSFTYTPVGQLASETGPWPDDTVSYLYRQMLRTNLTITEPGGSWVQDYSYDNGWRLQSLTSPAGSFGYTFNGGASPLVAGISLPNGASIVNSYNSLARLKETDLKNQSGQILDGYTYTSDSLGLRTNIVRNFGLMNSSVAVGYDNIGQITSWLADESSGTPRLNEQLGFGYDAADNLHLRTNNALVQTFTVDAANELTDVSRTGTLTVSGNTAEPTSSLTVNGQQAQTNADFTFASPGHSLNNGLNTFTNVARNMYGVLVTNVTSSYLPTSISLLYDQNGNLTNDGTHNYAYNAENELTNVSVAGQWQMAFVYDGLGRRRIEIDSAWQNNQWVVTNEILYIYDGYLPIQERDTNNNVLVTYTRGLDLSGTLQDAGGIGGLLARTDANGSTYYHADGSGNVTALMDANQYIVARYMYNPFGKLLGQWGSMASANEMRFSSMIQRDNLSLYPFRAYDANLQRWPNEDPMATHLVYYVSQHWNGTLTARQIPGELVVGLNYYEFCANNSINYVDLYGLSFWGRIGNGFTSAAAGAGSGALTGAGVGAVAGLGAGDWATVPTGALAGAIAGGLSGFVSGVFFQGPCYNFKNAVKNGGINGALAGITGGASEVAGPAAGFLAGATTGAGSSWYNGGNPTEIGAAGLTGGLFGYGGAIAPDGLAGTVAGFDSEVIGQDIGYVNSGNF